MHGSRYETSVREVQKSILTAVNICYQLSKYKNSHNSVILKARNWKKFMKDVGTNADKNILTVVNSCYQLPTAVKSLSKL